MSQAAFVYLRETQRKRTRLAQHLFLVRGECRCGLLIEIAARYLRIAVAFAGEKPSAVSAILAQQGGRIVFRVPLQKNEQASPVFHKHIGPGLGRSRHDTVTLRCECLLWQLIMTGMRNPPTRRRVLKDGVIFRFAALENPRELFGQRTSRDAVEMQHRGVRCKARPNRRNCVSFRPIDKLRHRWPIGLVGQHWCARLVAGYDQPIDARSPQCFDVIVRLSQIEPTGLAARYLRNREQPPRNCDTAIGGHQELAELLLGSLQRGIGHVVDQSYDDGLAVCELARSGARGRHRYYAFPEKSKSPPRTRCIAVPPTASSSA